MTAERRILDGGLAVAAVAVASMTLTPTAGDGWAWGAPLAELRWYATGLGSEATLVQLVGNLLLLAPLAALAVLRWPSLRVPARLVAVALAAAGTVEFLQWILPLGRVVSPLDAVLNTAGATAAGLLIARLHRSAARRIA